jgi:ADP-heptose:LPS heptosyltransferase
MNILFITSSRIGDAVLSTVILHYLEKKSPDLKVTVVCGELTTHLFKNIPFCTQIISLKKKKHSMHWFDLYKKLRASKFDEIYDLRGTLLGFFLKTHKLFRWKKKYHNEDKHQVESLKQMAKIENRDVAPKLWVDLKEGQTPNNQCLAVAPAANWIGKEWPASFFAKTLNDFLKAYPKATLAFFAAPHEAQVISNIVDKLETQFKDSLKIYSDLSIDQVCKQIKGCHAFLGNDSGLMHIAAALNVPVLALFGPSNEKRYGPYESLHKIVRTPESFKELQKKPDFSFSAKTCFMETLEPETVTNELLNFWRNHQGAM